MLVQARVLPKTLGAFLIAATISGTLPQSAKAEPTRATVGEGSEAKSPKKNKRKRTSTTRTGWPIPHSSSWIRLSHRQRRTPAQIAVEVASAQIGKPYRWGATGPSRFDCSGLTRFAWKAAGVNLPHSSRAQYASLRHVSVGELEPGDIVYRPGHVGIYLGKGRMIHAPQSGSRVQISPLGRVVGGARPQ